MFRVSKDEEGPRTVITVDGQLLGEHIEIVEACCSQASSRGKPVHFVLRDVSTVDRSGCALLHRLAAQGISVSATGVYTSYLVQSLGLAAGVAGRQAMLRKL